MNFYISFVFHSQYQHWDMSALVTTTAFYRCYLNYMKAWHLFWDLCNMLNVSMRNDDHTLHINIVLSLCILLCLCFLLCLCILLCFEFCYVYALEIISQTYICICVLFFKIIYRYWYIYDNNNSNFCHYSILSLISVNASF